MDPTTSSRGPGVEVARSFLFVLGDRSDRFPKVAASEADVVVCDLEDSVTTSAKTLCVRSRSHAGPYLRQTRPAQSGGISRTRGLSRVLLPEHPARTPGWRG